MSHVRGRFRVRATTISFAIVATLWLALCYGKAGAVTAFGYHGRQAKPAVLPTNLLSNPSIEKGSGSLPDAWQMGAEVSGVTYIWHASVGYKSKRSLCLKKTENRFFPIAQWFQTIPNKTGAKRLMVSAYVKARDVQKATLDVQFLGANGQPLNHKWAAYIGAANSGDPAANHDWKRYEDTVDIPEGTTAIVIAPQIYGPGVIWFDEVSAKPVP